MIWWYKKRKDPVPTASRGDSLDSLERELELDDSAKSHVVSSIPDIAVTSDARSELLDAVM